MGEYVYVSPSVTDLLGYNPTDLIGKAFVSIVYPDDIPIIQEEIVRSNLSGYQTTDDREYRIRNASGEWRWVVSKGTRVVDSSGKFVHFIGIIKDITEHKQADAKRQQLEEKAQVASRLAAVGEMAAGIAHEINNPLTGVIGFSQMILEKENVPEEIKDELKLIADGSQRVADIVKRLLTFARQTKPVKAMTNLNDLIDNTLKLRNYVLKTANIEVVTRFDPELPWSVVDPGQMQQVFLNLIVNAEQAMKEAHGRGTLTITTEKKENNIRMSFQDDGPGITREIMKRLFEPFFTTKAPGEGTGLGLSLSRSIILEHNGKLYVESEPGHGADFIVELPIIDSTEPETEELPAAAMEKPASTQHGNILVVDDESGVRIFLKKALTQMGHTVDTIADAQTAMEKLDSGTTYDIILTDVRMAGISGIELYFHIIEKTPAMKNRIVFITGDIMGPDIKNFFTQNGLTYLTKPFSIETMREKINRILMTGQPNNNNLDGSGR
jgi:PAS domain S-box-containing protein